MSVINTNMLSLVAQHNLNKSADSLATSIERLSSGLRINSAKDDAAGSAIANRFTANIRGLTQASRNANDGISMTQTAEGALSSISDNLQRIRELAVQAVNGTNTSADKQSIQNEITARFNEIDRTSQQTDFNGNKVLASAQTVNIQVGAADGQTIAVNLTKADSSTLLGAATTTVDVTNTANDATRLATIDTAIANVDTQRSALGALQNRFGSAVTNLGTTVNNLTSSRSRIQDADYATEVSNMTRSQILQQAGTSVLSKANQSTQGVLSLLQ
ncbi:flagellin [Paraherbaspirillum soli]|uniref:Flagellin n=1 Tax=Paraherbaspirillum soli TaxID=631222 RepID=A0ABW0MCN2_9BURK